MNINSLRLPSDRLPTEYPWRVAVSIYIWRAYTFLSFLSMGLVLFITVLTIGDSQKEGADVLWITLSLLLQTVLILFTIWSTWFVINYESLRTRVVAMDFDAKILLAQLRDLTIEYDSLVKSGIRTDLPIDQSSIEVRRFSEKVEALKMETDRVTLLKKDLERDMKSFQHKTERLNIRMPLIIFRMPQIPDVQKLETAIERLREVNIKVT